MDMTPTRNTAARCPRKSRQIRLLKSGTMVLALLCAGPALAQEFEVAEDGSVRLGTIFMDVLGRADDDANSVVASELWVGGKVATSILDTPASVSVITEKEIKQRKATTTEEVLQYSAAIHTDYYGTDDRNDYFQIRGFQATTYRDGLTLGTMRGVREEPLAYERVEVMRGSNSTLFGMGDPGGSVNFVSRQPKFERIAETSIGFDSHGSKEVGFDFGNEIAGQDLAFRFTGKLRDGKREYDFSKDDETFLMAGLTWRPTEQTSLSVILDYLERDATPNSGGYPLGRDFNRSNFFGEPDFNYQNVERSSASMLLTHDFGNGLSLRSNLRYSDMSDSFGYVYLAGYVAGSSTLLHRDYYGAATDAEELIGNVILQYDTNLGQVASSTLAGIEFREAKTHDISFYEWRGAGTIDVTNPVYTGGPTSITQLSNYKSDYSAKSLFVTQNFSFDERLIVTAGLRRDYLDLSQNGIYWGAPVNDSDSFGETSGRFALTYKVTDDISVYASYVESVAPPRIGVKAERGEQYEVGAKYAPEGMNAIFSASVYDLTKNNISVTVLSPNAPPSIQTVGEARVRGLDLEARTEINDNLSLIGSYSYMKTEVVSAGTGSIAEGKEFTAAPRHMASVWATYRMADVLPQGEMTAGLGLRYLGAYYYDTANLQKGPDALLVDASLAMDLNESTSLTLNVSNLLDEQHVVGSGTANYYNPGRAVSLSLHKSW